MPGTILADSLWTREKWNGGPGQFSSSPESDERAMAGNIGIIVKEKTLHAEGSSGFCGMGQHRKLNRVKERPRSRHHSSLILRVGSGFYHFLRTPLQKWREFESGTRKCCHRSFARLGSE
jgi:hypothetical protein